MASSIPVNGHGQRAGSDQEWTRVRRKGRRHLEKHQGTDPNSHFSGPTPRQPFLSIFDIQSEHRRITDQWESSTCCLRLREIVTSRSSHSGVSQAICFGLGSFDPENGSWEGRRTAHVQLAAFLCIVEQLQRNSSQAIACLFQEPLFNSVDKAFIQSLGHEIVDSPEGFDRVTPSTLVFGIHLYRDIYNQTVAKHLPAMFVGTSYDVWEEFRGFSQSEFAKMKELDEQCAKVEFPEDPGYATFSSTTIHWKRQDET
ncbi:hypothetical protein F4820DRAFT_416638 [Hypoxylon rubiginosum]|uniref:Uncharacterized protein n=1 Tax=Hypoxylon rubiginosum TaxID=110542 RepID=A0ACB9Z5E5_9PEZI|nr:hypothetical protein F4820DRAFT_416638 [Hypoxylon rubiginosum]